MRLLPVAFILSSVFMVSCSKPELTLIQGFPKGVTGCSCYFAQTEQDFRNNKFIYLDSYYEDPAFISIDGKIIEIDPSKRKDEDYKVQIQFDREEQNGEETSWKTGVLKVELKDGTILESKFVGECGC